MIIQKKGPITFEDILRHSLDQQVGPIDSLVVNCTRAMVEDKMLAIIKRRGLLDTLLVELGLCSICQEKQNSRRVAR